MIKVKFIQPNFHNEEIHSNNIQSAELALVDFNQNIMEDPCNLVYDDKSEKLITHPKEDDNRPKLSPIIADNINKLLSLARAHDSKDYILKLYLKYVKEYFEEHKSDSENLRIIFQNLYLNNFFDEKSADFFKEKINESLNILK